MWSGDGKRVLFQSNREGDSSIFWQRVDGTGSAERVTKAEDGIAHFPSSWAPNSQRFAFYAFKGSVAKVTLWTYSLQDKKAALFVADPSTASQAAGEFSPDGRWLAYQSNETGRYEVYAQPFPATGAKFQITRGGSTDNHHPLWSPDGKELFYVNDGRLFSVAIQTQPGLTFANPVPLPITGFTQAVTTARQYDITPDGKQFIVVLPPGQGTGNARPTVPIQIVLNWFEDLKQRVPTGKH